MDLAIHTEHLTKVYGGRVIAVNDMSFQVPKGAVYGLLGPNGAGKTTTLRLLLGLQRPTAGRAEVFGHRCSVNSTSVRQMIGYLPTHPTLPGHLRPVDYLNLVGKMCRVPSRIRVPRLTTALQTVGLQDATSKRIKTFSTGMRTRLGIAASLLAEPPLLLWDEPTAGLDPAARRFVLDLIRSMRGKHTILVATHILSDIDQICDHVGVMHEGRMIFSDSMREMKRRLRGGDFTLEVDGSREAAVRVVGQIRGLEGVIADMRDQHTIMVRIADNCSQAATIAQVLNLVDAAGLKLQSIHSGSDNTENAYLQLLHEEETHGFHRFSFQDQRQDDAVPGAVET